MGNIERFKTVGFDEPYLEIIKKSGDAELTVLSGTFLLNFTALEHGDFRYSSCDDTNSLIHLPFGSVAAANLSDEREILFKHFRKQSRHQFGLVAVFFGGTINYVTKENKKFYFMKDPTDEVIFPERDSIGGLGPIDLRCFYLE